MNDHRVQVDGPPHLSHSGEVAEEGLLGGKVYRGYDAQQKAEDVEMPELYSTGLDERGKDEGQDHGAGGGCNQELPSIQLVGPDPCPSSEEENREGREHGHNA